MVKIKSKFSQYYAIALVGLLLIMVYTHNVSLFYAVLGGCALVIHKPQVIFPVYFVASFSTSYFAIGEGLSAGRYLSVILIVSLIVNLLIKGKNPLENKHLATVALLIIYTFFSAAFGYDGSLNIFFLMLQNLVVIFLLQQQTEFNIKKLFQILLVSSVLTTCFIFYDAVINSSMLTFQSRFYGNEDDINANRLAMIIVQCAAIQIVSFFQNKNIIIKTTSLIVFFIGVLIIIATGSRTALISVFATALLSMLYIGRIGTGKVIASGVLFLIVYLFVSYFSQIDSPLLERFTVEALQSDKGSSRGNYMGILLTEIFPDHFLFGSGVGGSNMKVLGHSYGLENLSHNIIVDPLTQMGLVGSAIYLFFLIPIFKKTFKLFRIQPQYAIAIFLLFASCVNGIGETIFYEKFFWNNLALCLLCYNIYHKSSKQSQIDLNGTI